MKKMLAILLALLLLTGCSAKAPAPTEAVTEPATEATVAAETVAAETVPAATTAPVRENRLLFFTKFDNQQDNITAHVHYVDVKMGHYVESDHVDILWIAKDAALETFDLRSSIVLDETSIQKTDPIAFQTAALQLNGMSPVIYMAEIANGVLYSARSELTFLSTEEETFACPTCNEVFADASSAQSHTCATTTNAQSSGNTELCPVCSESFPEGDAFLNHECIGSRVICYDCKNWYMAGYEFLTHRCMTYGTTTNNTSTNTNTNTSKSNNSSTSNKTTTTPVNNTFQCGICLLKFETRSAFDNHYCQGTTNITCGNCKKTFATTYEYDNHSCNGKKKYIQCTTCGCYYQKDHNHVCIGTTQDFPCGYCGIVFSSLSAFNNHRCQSITNITCASCHKTFTTTYDYDTHTCFGDHVEYPCSKCGVMFSTKSAYDNHKCQGVTNITCYGCKQTFSTTHAYDTHSCPANMTADFPCGYCGIVFSTQSAYDNHKCQGITNITCYGCGRTFANTHEYDIHYCPANSPEMTQCEYCLEWMEAGSVYRAHVLNKHTNTTEMVQCEYCFEWVEAGNMYRAHILNKHTS